MAVDEGIEQKPYVTIDGVQLTIDELDGDDVPF